MSGVLDDIVLPLLPRCPEGGGAEAAEAVAVDEDGVEDGALHRRESGAVPAVAASQAEGFFFTSLSPQTDFTNTKRLVLGWENSWQFFACVNGR